MMRISLDSRALIAVRNWLAGSATPQPQRPGRKASRTQFRTEQLEPRMMLDAGMSALLPDLVAASDTGASDSDNVTHDRTPALTGSVQGEASQVWLVVDGRRVAVLPVVNGTWNYVVPADAALAAGKHTIAVRPVAASGKAGFLSPPLSVTVVTASPTASMLNLGLVSRRAGALSSRMAAALRQAGLPQAGSPTVWAAVAGSTTLVAGTPRVGSPAASDGRVTGAAVFVNSGGGTVNYVGPGVSAGGGSVSVDGAGGFVYTPTTAQRRAATPVTTDTFTVTASNGRDSASQTITVRVDPGRLVAAGATVGTPNLATGVVSGSSGLSDNVGRTVTFTVSGVPTFRTGTGTSAAPGAGGLSSTGVSAGGGAVSVDATGAFLYTPTQAQRRAAVAGSTDTFWVTANNTLGLRTQQITVPIDPGTPVAGSTTPGTPDTGTGAVTGTAVFTDTAGRTLTYSTTGSSDGGGTVSVNPSTGAFTYIPTQAQRQAATESTTDTFTITADNGVRTTSQTVTVAVDPGTPVAGTPTVNSPTVGSATFSSRYLPANPTTSTVFTATTLNEVIGITGRLGGAWVASGVATPYYYTNNGTTATVQLQYLDSTFVKVVKVRLTQSGSNVVATVLYAKYAASSSLGANFDSLSGATAVPIATSASSAGYGVSQLTITTKVVTGSAAFTDTAGRTLTYSAPATSTGGGKVTINPNTGAFIYVPTQAQRQAATDSTTDTFAVTVNNGVRTATQTITVPVL